MTVQETDLGNGWWQEGGADTAAEMLRQYNPATGTWNLERKGEFWEAVELARQLGRQGEGQTIAVVDDGFDLSLPALARHSVGFEGNDRTVHGTIVALLILEVAPKARLILYPAGNRNPDLIKRALNEVVDTPATIVNLSLGQAFPTDSVMAPNDYFLKSPLWSDMSQEDIPYWRGQRLGELHDGWRALFRPPQSLVGTAAAAVAGRGLTVVAATGNRRGYIYEPAAQADVISVSFKRANRFVVDSLTEMVAITAPTYSQSEFSDVSILQPRDVLGSSFAAPLMSGLAAIMVERSELPAYRKAAWLASLAASLFVNLRPHDAWSDRRDGVLNELFSNAVRALPHSHVNAKVREPCPECAFLAVDIYVNFGLFKLNWGDLDGAEALLSGAESFAPKSPHAAANLGVVYAERARRARVAGHLDEVSRLLQEAALLAQKAAQLRPEYEAYRRRAEEFLTGAQRPGEW